MKGSRIALSGFALGVVATLALTAAVPERPAEAAPKLSREGFQTALGTVFDRYVDPVDGSKLLGRALKHVVSGLDPHSYYLTADERRAFRKRASGGSAGLSVVLKGNDLGAKRWLEVVGVAPSSPAAAAGIAPGDHILRIRGHEVSGLLSQAEVEALLAGSPGETISVTAQRQRDPGPQTYKLELTGKKAKLVAGKLVKTDAGKVAHVRIRAFRSSTGQKVKRVLANLRRAAHGGGLTGIVLDLRGNPGGEVDQALVVADLFVKDGILTRTRGRGGRILREERAHAAGTDETTPLVVVQDRHSASAAELLAAALRENGRATVVGERSYGKGTVQDVVGLKDGSVLTLTVARYFSPKDHVIDGIGVAPDIPVTFQSRVPASARDRGLTAALKQLGQERAD